MTINSFIPSSSLFYPSFSFFFVFVYICYSDGWHMKILVTESLLKTRLWKETGQNGAEKISNNWLINIFRSKKLFFLKLAISFTFSKLVKYCFIICSVRQLQTTREKMKKNSFASFVKKCKEWTGSKIKLKKVYSYL